MKSLADIFRTEFRSYNDDLIDANFKDIGINSIDLISIRINLEKKIGCKIPDSAWFDFNTFQDIINYCKHHSYIEKALVSNPRTLSLKRKYIVNMPQMNNGALSENWLFKESGDVHWALICKGLNTTTSDLKDEFGNRLYASFIRIRWVSSAPLNKVLESSEIALRGIIKRCGNSLYSSNINSKAGDINIKAHLSTIFSIRNDDDNRKLVKSQPAGVLNFVKDADKEPDFFNEYKLIKKGQLLKLGSHENSFKLDFKTILYEKPYIINPYYDINGVGLVYFAAYPAINDFCESFFFNDQKFSENKWERTFYTSFRDVFYFSNCNMDDHIIYRLHSYEFISENKIKIISSLFRKSDNELMARIFTVKEKAKTK